MIGYEVLLDGQALGDIDPCVLVEDVRVQPVMRLTSQPLGRGAGSQMLRRMRESLMVTVLFEVHEPDPVRRQALLDRVQAWREGRVLTLSTHPGRVLRVVCTAAPAPSALRWTEQLTMTFTAYDMPFWEAENAAFTEAEGTDAELVLNLPGTADTVLEGEATNRSMRTCQRMRLLAGDEALAFEGLALAPGETLRITHDHAGRLSLTVAGAMGERSAFAARTEQSADEVWLQPGRNVIQCSADQPLFWRVQARGRWL